MASLQFQIHTDKENANATNIKGVGGRFRGAKSFNSLKTPRRALGSVNEANRVGLVSKAPAPLKLKEQSALKPKNSLTSKDSKLKQRQKVDKENDVQRVKQPGVKEFVKKASLDKQEVQPALDLPDIEYMPPTDPYEETDEDLLPMKERASTYVHKLLSWRPQCLFGTQPDSDEEAENEKELKAMMEALDNLPPLCEDDAVPVLPELELEEVEDVELPFIDDLMIPAFPSVLPDFLDSSDTVVPTSRRSHITLPPPEDCSFSSLHHIQPPAPPQDGSASSSAQKDATSTYLTAESGDSFLEHQNISAITAQPEKVVDHSLPECGDISAIKAQPEKNVTPSLSECTADKSEQDSHPDQFACAESASTNTDNSLGQLEDSMIGLEQHFGSLQINSCPSTPSQR